MRKKILSAILCVCFGLLGTLGCEKKSKEEQVVKDATESVKEAAETAADETEDFLEEVEE